MDTSKVNVHQSRKKCSFESDFNDTGISLCKTPAYRSKGDAAPSPSQLVIEGHDDSGSIGSVRMSDGYGASIGVRPLP